MKWTEKKTIHVPTTVEKTVEVECALVIHKKHHGFDSMTSHEYVPATVDDLRRAAESLGLLVQGPFVQCICGANAVCAGFTGPQHAPDCELNKVLQKTVTLGGGTESSTLTKRRTQ